MSFRCSVSANSVLRAALLYVLRLTQLYRRRIQLAIALVKYKTRLQKPREGICSAWITRLATGVRLPLRIVPGTLLVPANAETPIITIGPGTGIAPLRAIVQERVASAPPAHDNLVIIGCRYAARDFLFKNEWETLAAREAPSAANDADSVADAIERLRLSSTPLIELHVAASRDQENKIYVQDVLRKYGEKVWSILGQRRGIAYLSGYVVSLTAVRPAACPNKSVRPCSTFSKSTGRWTRTRRHGTS